MGDTRYVFVDPILSGGGGKFLLKIVIFCHFEYFYSFLVQNYVWGVNFQFLAKFHEYTLTLFGLSFLPT